MLSLYAAFFLFVGHPEVSLFAVGSVPLTLYLVVALLLLPLIGNLVPSKVSFLVAMRYYAGNWAWNAWLFRNDSHRKLDTLKRAAPLLREQQERFLSGGAGRASGLAGCWPFARCTCRAAILGMLLPRAIDGHPFQEYTYVDGETVAGSVLGWNFGEGHLADERLLAAVQQQCGFEDGELRVICVEAQPILGSTLHWRIVDAQARAPGRGPRGALGPRQAQALGLRRGLTAWTTPSSSARARTDSPPRSSWRERVRPSGSSKPATRSAAGSAPPS